MVSLTFDEFHALRNRQRAVEEAASKPLPSKSSALSANAVVSRGLAQETDSTDAASQEKVFVEKNDDAVAPSSATVSRGRGGRRLAASRILGSNFHAVIPVTSYKYFYNSHCSRKQYRIKRLCVVSQRGRKAESSIATLRVGTTWVYYADLG